MRSNFKVAEKNIMELVNFEGYLPKELFDFLVFGVNPGYRTMYYDNLKDKGLYEEVKEEEYSSRYLSVDEIRAELISFLNVHPQFSKFFIWEPYEKLVDQVAVIAFGDELAELDDFVPPIFLSIYSMLKRKRWINEKNMVEIKKRNKEYFNERISLLKSSHDKYHIFIMETMLEFVDKYPHFSRLIKDYSAFNDILYKMKYSETPKYDEIIG